MKNWKDDAFAEGAATSLQKTLAEIDAILEGDELEKAGNLREKLRKKLIASFEKLSDDWLRHGFNGGHIVAVQEFLKSGTVPVKISRTIEREFPIRGKSAAKSLKVESKLPPKLKARLQGGSGA